jgi:7,8-dihydropterin-6-yl-methyl-4-(beta-D-ribofuranosyl)aminobenzene 5'-phosphate synthase
MTLIRKITFITAALTLLALVAGCGGNPTFTRIATPVSQASPTATSVSPTVTPAPPPAAAVAQARDLRITVVYDNIAHDSRLKTAWGFAALIESGGQTLLFDTGGDAPTLLDDLKTLGIDPNKIQSIILSHLHTDHTGGLSGLLQTGIHPTLYLPPSFPDSFKQSVKTAATLAEIAPGQPIAPEIFTTGEMRVADFVEQALVIKTDAGLVVLTGCAHPGIVPIVTRAKELFGEPVYLVMGGLHLPAKSAAEIRSILSDLRQLGVQRVAPSHCTGDQAIEMFAAEYGDNFIRSGAGRIFTLSAASTSHPFDAAWDDRAVFRQGLIASEQEALNRLPGASVYRIDLRILDDLSVVKGQMQVRYTNQETKPLDEIYFRLFANALGGKASVSAVKVDGQSVEPNYESQNTAVRVPLATALPPGKSVVIRMDYQVQIPRELGGSYGLLSYSDAVLALDSVYPSIPVYDD